MDDNEIQDKLEELSAVVQLAVRRAGSKGKRKELEDYLAEIISRANYIRSYMGKEDKE